MILNGDRLVQTIDYQWKLITWEKPMKTSMHKVIFYLPMGFEVNYRNVYP